MQLAELDSTEWANEETRYRLMSRSWDEEHSSTRSDLVKELQGKLEEYDGLVLREHQLLKIKAPSKKNHRQYFRYMWNTKPLCEEETRFICQEDDMLYLSTDAEAAWMESAFDFIIAILPAKVMKLLFETTQDQGKVDDENSNIYSTRRLIFVIKSLILLMCLTLLILPVILLYVVNTPPGPKIGIITAFMVLFAGCMLCVTRAQRHEVFVSAATYCAVLVFFLGGLQPLRT